MPLIIPQNLPAYEPVPVFGVQLRDGDVRIVRPHAHEDVGRVQLQDVLVLGLPEEDRAPLPFRGEF